MADPGSDEHATDPAASDESPQATGLDERLQRQLVQWAATAIGAIPVATLPARLRPFARFSPRRRAELAGPQLLAALSDAGFRDRVVQVLGEQADPGPDAPPVAAAAAAWLRRSPEWRDRVAVVPVGRSEAASEGMPTTRLTEQLMATRAAARRDRVAARAEVDGLRTALAAARAQVQRAERAAAAVSAQLRSVEQERDLLRAELSTAAGLADSAERRLRARIEALSADLAGSRRESRLDRSAADVRLRLLVQTLVGAAHGVAAELALPVAQPTLPADTVAARPPGDPGADVIIRWDEPSTLTALMSLPGAHLIVDGYNVTKAVLQTLTLEQQRTQLLRVLAALAAQTRAEVTAVFDGSDVTAVPAAAVRGVRVRFSPPRVTADSVIRAMARAEPPGRPVLVVSSDREVAEGVARVGVRSAPASVLTDRLLAGRTV